MLTPAINLLPWRNTLYKKQLKRFLLSCFLGLIFIISLLGVIYSLTNHFIQKRQLLQTEVHQQLKIINQYHQNIQYFKKQHTENAHPKLVYFNISHLLKNITHMPLKSGGLNEFILQNNTVELHGATSIPSELDKMTNFLKTQPLVRQIQLQKIEKKKNYLFYTLKITLKDNS